MAVVVVVSLTKRSGGLGVEDDGAVIEDTLCLSIAVLVARCTGVDV